LLSKGCYPLQIKDQKRGSSRCGESGNLMDITFGKYKGKLVETIVLKEPDYVLWLLNQNDASVPLAAVLNETKRLINIFDKKDFQQKCFGCDQNATYCTAYTDNVTSPYWWCNKCNPYQSGAIAGKLQSVRSYQDAIRYVHFNCNANKAALKLLIKIMSEAKGLPERARDNNVKEFFGIPVVSKF